MTTPTFFNCFTENVAEKVHNLGSDTLKWMLTNSAPVDGLYTLKLADVVFTAVGGAIGPFRYVVLYNDTGTNDPLIMWLDYGSSISIPDGETFTVDADATNRVLTLAAAHMPRQPPPR